MPKFEVTFVDGKKLVKETDTADLAKAQAKAERQGEISRDAPRSAPEVMVAKVTRLE